MIEIVVALLCGICTGFLLGRYSGYQDGRSAGEAYAPLLLRAIALEQGKCPVCDHAPPKE